MKAVTLRALKGLMTRIQPLMLFCLICATAIARAGIIQDVTASADEIRSGATLQIGFRLSESADVTLTILDSDLRPVRVYALKSLQPRAHTVAWDARDTSGHPVAPEAYPWTIRANTSGATELWEPADLHSRTMDQIRGVHWDLPTRTVSYRLNTPMRIWGRIGVQMGACMRLLAEGEPRPAGLVTEFWDGFDESGVISLHDRRDLTISVVGYRLPRPCVLVTGSSMQSENLQLALSPLHGVTPPISVLDPWWTRRRAFVLLDRYRAQLRIEQLDSRTFAASLIVPDALRKLRSTVLQSVLSQRIRLKWFIDGHCAGEDVDAIMPSLITLLPDQIPSDGASHFVTANLTTVMHQAIVGSAWIEQGKMK